MVRVGRRAILAGFLAACSSGESDVPPKPAASGSAGAGPQPVPAPGTVARPTELRATGVVADPQHAHDLLKDSYGFALLSGRSWCASALAWLSLPMQTVDTFDERAPLRLAALELPAGATAWLVAVALRAPDRFLAACTLGSSAPFRGRRDDAAGLDWLTPEHPEGRPALALGVARNHLVIGSSAAALTSAAAYLADPGAARGAASPASGALMTATSDVALLDRAMTELATKLAPPGLDPSSLLEGGALTDALAGASSAELSLVADAASWSLELRGAAKAGASAREHGSRAALLEVPADTTAAAVWFEDEASRVESAKRGVAWLQSSKLLGSAADETARALAELGAARGAAARIGLTRANVGWVAHAAIELKESEKAEAALDALGKALETDAPGGVVTPKVTLEKTVIERLGEARKLRVERGEKAVAALVLRVDGGRLWIGAGAAPVDVLRELAARPMPLASIARLAKLAEALPERVSRAAVVDPVTLLAPAGPGASAGPAGALFVATSVDGAAARIVAAGDAPALLAIAGRALVTPSPLGGGVK
ncbi:MAG: hypothetical protein U0271_01170 [Polyangiaceae bacterium]